MGLSNASASKHAYFPRRANSMDLMAVVLEVPVVTLNEAATFIVSVSYTNIYEQMSTRTVSAGHTNIQLKGLFCFSRIKLIIVIPIAITIPIFTKYVFLNETSKYVIKRQYHNNISYF